MIQSKRWFSVSAIATAMGLTLGLTLASAPAWAEELAKLSTEGVTSEETREEHTLMLRELEAMEVEIARRYRERGSRQLQLGDIDAAITSFRKAIRLKPDESKAHFALGVVYGRKGQLEAAIASFKEVVRLDSDNTDSHFALGVVYGRKGQLEAAITSYKEVVRLNPNYARAHFNLGLVYAKLGDYQKVLEEYRWLKDQAPALAEKLDAKVSAARVTLSTNGSK